MELIGVKSIKFSGIILFTTIFVVPVLKGSNNGVIGDFSCSKLECFWYQKQFFGLFLHPILCCMGLFDIESNAAMYRMRLKSKALFLVPKTFQFISSSKNPLTPFLLVF
jgi:hypothetical protein